MVAFIGVDVGTGSARAGLVTETGQLLASAQHPIRMWRTGNDIVEQSSEDIWTAVVTAIREVMAKTAANPDEVAGIGFDATCSLVVVDAEGTPVTVSPTGEEKRNVIVWMDHRAVEQADRINRTGHPVLSYVGGTISPEMQTPKLLWLKENLPETFNRAGHFFDLADWLTYRATGSTDRSVCTVTCKWTYLAHEARWDADYFEKAALSELSFDGFGRIGSVVVPPGTAIGSGLTEEAAYSLGLRPSTPVGAGAIDAHAGGIGTLGVGANNGTQMAYVFGTSACAMASSAKECFVPGVWGPYYASMLPDMWLLEGGQSAAGAAIDHLLRCHPFLDRAQSLAKFEALPLTSYLEQQIGRLFPSVDGVPTDIHVVPEFLGNRSPFADPYSHATVTGLTLADNLESLCELYLAGVAGVAYGARQIVEAMNAQGVGISQIVVSGGAGQSNLIRQMLADAIGVEVGIPTCSEPVLLGAAILGAAASGHFDDLSCAMSAMTKTGEIKRPRAGRIRQVHNARYEVFRLLQETERQIRRTMAQATAPLESAAHDTDDPDVLAMEEFR